MTKDKNVYVSFEIHQWEKNSLFPSKLNSAKETPNPIVPEGVVVSPVDICCILHRNRQVQMGLEPIPHDASFDIYHLFI